MLLLLLLLLLMLMLMLLLVVLLLVLVLVMFLDLRDGTFTISGTRVATSKFVIFLHSPFLPSWWPWSLCSTIMVESPSPSPVTPASRRPML